MMGGGASDAAPFLSCNTLLNAVVAQSPAGNSQSLTAVCAALQEAEAERLMRQEEEDAMSELEQELQLSKAQIAEAEAAAEAEAEAAAEAGRKAEAELKATMAANLKEKGDLFDSMIESEQRIRLGEDGWKDRYYQVCCLDVHATLFPEACEWVCSICVRPCRQDCGRCRAAVCRDGKGLERQTLLPRRTCQIHPSRP